MMPALATSRSTLPHSFVARSTIASNLLEVRDIGAVGHGNAAGLANFLDHGFGRRQRSAAAVARAAEIVDHDLGAAARQPQRMRAAKAIARAGDDRDASIKPDCHECRS